VRRLHGRPYARLHPAFDATLRETFGIMVYQEDVSRVAIALAGFGIEEADTLRKVLSKKGGRPKLAAFRERFLAGARAAGLAPNEAAGVWEMILSFDGYSFCKAHSASYAQVSYRLAWLKLHYPLEFLVSVINNGGGFYTRQTYLDEVRRRGFAILGPDVNRSALEYTVENGRLRIGLGQLQEIKRSFLERLLAERAARGAYQSVREFCARTRPGYPEMRVLIRSGSLDGISGDVCRPGIFFLFFQYRNAPDDFGFFPPRVPDFVTDYSPAARLRAEVESLGLIVSRHPLSVFAPRIRACARSRPGLPLIDSRGFAAHVNLRVAIAGTIVTGKEVRTRTNRAMMFVSFSDEQAIFETVFFPETYDRYRFLLEEAAAFFLIGVVKEELGALSLQVEEVERLTRDPERHADTVSLMPQTGAVWAGYW
jgi:error-prone DNA polymerase